MKYVKLGRTGLKVSRLCLGTMNFGNIISEDESFAIMNKALDLGINYFDTADVYGWNVKKGLTEEIIGNWLTKHKGNRDKIVLATKVFGEMGEGVNERGLSAYHIKKACEDSLRRLKTDHIDIYQMHHIDRNTSFDEIWQAMEQLVREGKILYVGSSNFAGWNIAKAQETALKRNFFGLVSEQSLYNLTNRNIELEVIPACRDYGIGLIVWSPLAGGLLAGVLGNENGVRRPDKKKIMTDKNRKKIEKYENLCKRIGLKPATVALAWLLHNEVVTAPIIGPRTLRQLEDSMEALEVKLSKSALEKLDKIWPGQGGEAPEAYAW